MDIPDKMLFGHTRKEVDPDDLISFGAFLKERMVEASSYWIERDSHEPKKVEAIYLTVSKGKIVPCYWHEYPSGWRFQSCLTNDDEGMNGFEVTHWHPNPSLPELKGETKDD